MTRRSDRSERSDATREELADLTTALVSVPSHEDETAAGDAIESWLREETDARVERDDVGNVLARTGAGDRSLALVGHHDVVPPDESQVTDDGGYVVEERDGRIYGRGAADMKGAVAAAMLALRDATPPEGTELVFASFVGEEVGGVGARHAIDEGFAPDHAIVAEGSTNYSAPGVTDVVVAHKGRRASTLVAHGSAAHASEPEAGVNAVYRACDAVDLVRDLAPPEAEVFGERVAGSLVVTEIDGGSAWNVVPERCEVTIDERTVPGDRADIGSVEAAVEGVEWVVEQDLPPMACSDEAFADRVLDVAREVQTDADATPQHVLKPHATDAGWLAGAGTACVVCGASEPGEAHTKTESVSLDVLERCYRVYRGVADGP
ncbi:M20/M25/M40 family metallo-hydrolase [Salinirubellus salinus]|uniref:M20/M25/M40 family metallo-hydrolase n=1 Tax=Salinirubellus salinus TaxID=1364945 RepID=A0A9E7U750_9EURY|nr:M20/M25/M40 family metallo-hydrolase [Salinirubellus salinus]UWM53176.1 M20/M25/M40 family metallo-hydrolase [Salinirubellus salinus]